MPKGRKRKPSNIHKLHGNPGKRARNTKEPQPTVCIPKPPKHISRLAKREWRRVTPHLEQLGILSEIDSTALAAYCQSYSRWVSAEKKLALYGEIVKSPNGYPIQSPYLAVSNTALKFMRDFATEFGMTPSSRSRVSITGEPSRGKLARFLESG